MCVCKEEIAERLRPQHHSSLPRPLFPGLEDRRKGSGWRKVDRSPVCSTGTFASVCLDVEHACALCPSAVLFATSGWKVLWHFLSGFQWCWGILLFPGWDPALWRNGTEHQASIALCLLIVGVTCTAALSFSCFDFLGVINCTLAVNQIKPFLPQAVFVSVLPQWWNTTWAIRLQSYVKSPGVLTQQQIQLCHFWPYSACITPQDYGEHQTIRWQWFEKWIVRMG